jgi:hypothetical protein
MQSARPDTKSSPTGSRDGGNPCGRWQFSSGAVDGGEGRAGIGVQRPPDWPYSGTDLLQEALPNPKWLCRRLRAVSNFKAGLKSLKEVIIDQIRDFFIIRLDEIGVEADSRNLL